MSLEKLESENKVSILRLKQHFAKQYPKSAIIPYLQSLPDEISAEELIGAVGVWLSILDYEKQQVLNSSTPQSKEVMK